MKKYFVTFRKSSPLFNHYVTIHAFSIDEASSIANGIFKNVDMVYYEEKFTPSMYFKGQFTEVKVSNFLLQL